MLERTVMFNKSKKLTIMTEDNKSFWRNIKRNWELVVMAIPGFVWFLLFAYIPMIGIVIAFKDYNMALGIFGSPWVGLQNFEFFFKSGKAWQLTVNTFTYNILMLVVSMIARLALAIFLAEISGKYLKKFCQSVSLLPHFISWVTVSVFFYAIFNFESGIFNVMLEKFGGDRIQIYSTPGVWKYLIVFVSTWKEVGYGSIVFLAATYGIDRSLYEAAEIDGAGIWKRVWHITIPSLIPTIITVTLLSLGNILRGNYEMFYQLVGDAPALREATEVIDTYVFKAVLSGTDYGMTSAVSLYQSAICFVTVVVVNWLIRKYDKDYALY